MSAPVFVFRPHNYRAPRRAPESLSPGQRMAANPLKITMEFLNLAEIGGSARVCNAWHEAIDGKAQSNMIWGELSERMRIPLVTSQDDQLRDRKSDLRTLFPITTSGQQIAETLGEPVGETPTIDAKWFNLLSQVDPDEPRKLMGQTWRFVCVYREVERLLDAKTPLILGASGTLEDVGEEYNCVEDDAVIQEEPKTPADPDESWDLVDSPEAVSKASTSKLSKLKAFGKVFHSVKSFSSSKLSKLKALGKVVQSVNSFFRANSSSSVQSESVQELKPTRIPLSVRNLKMLSEFPLKGQKHMPVFNARSCEFVIEQSVTPPSRNMIYFMRDKVMPESRYVPRDDQVALVKARGEQLGAVSLGETPLEIRVLSSVISILNKGTCSDNSSPLTFAGSSNAVDIDGIKHQAGSGFFVPGAGLIVHSSHFSMCTTLGGIAPGCPAEGSLR